MDNNSSPAPSLQNMEWSDAIETFGQPVESSTVTDEQWEDAKNSDRVVSILRDETGINYTGIPGTHADRLMCQVVFETALPPGVKLINVSLDDIDWNFSKEVEDAENATENLLASCVSGDIIQLKQAIACGADIHCQYYDETPLELATVNGHYECVIALLDAKADISQERGKKLWQLAILHAQPDIAAILEQHGVQPPLDQTLIQAAHAGNIPVARELIGKGANVNQADFLSPYYLTGTVLAIAILSEQSEMVEFLLSNGADAAASHPGNVSPWVAAAATDQNELCSRLESMGAQQNLDEALAVACQLGNIDIAAKLISAGADPATTVTMHYGKCTPLAVAYVSSDIGKGLYKIDAEETDDIEEIRSELFDLLLSNGADANQCYGSGWEGHPFLLCAAEAEERHGIVDVLIKHHANVNITDQRGKTALHVAVEYGNEQAVKHLLLGGADPNFSNKKGEVPFMDMFYECHEPSVKIAKWLIAFGADLSAKTEAGRSIMSYAKRALRKAVEAGDDTDSHETLIEMLKAPKAFREYSGVMLKSPCTSEEAFTRANCALLWLEDLDTCAAALTEAMKMDPEAISRVITDLDDEERTVRYASVRALSNIGPDASPAIPQLIERLDDDPAAFFHFSEGIAYWAARALQNIGSAATMPLLKAIGTLSTDGLCIAVRTYCEIDGSQQMAVLQPLKDRIPADEDSLTGDAAIDAAKYYNLIASIHHESGDIASAIQACEASLRLNSSLGNSSWHRLATLKSSLGDDSYTQAMNLYSQGQRLEYFSDDQYEEVKNIYLAAIDKSADFPWGYNNLAWLLSTCDDLQQRDGKTAVILAKQAAELTRNRCGGILDTLAAAYAELGDFDNAVQTQEQAISVAPGSSQAEFEFNLDRYRSGLKWAAHEPEALEEEDDWEEEGDWEDEDDWEDEGDFEEDDDQE